MRIERLEYFLAVADTGHVGRAAQRLRISQPALSQQIRKLEAHLRTQLLDRTPRGVELTPAGRLLADRARVLVRQLDRLERDVTAYGAGQGGSLTVAHTRSASDATTRALVETFRDQHPAVEVATRSGWTSWNLHQLLEGDLDAAFVRGPVRHRSVRLTVVAEQELVALLPGGWPRSEHPISPDTLRARTLVFWPRDQAPEAYDDVMTQLWGDAPPPDLAPEADGEQIVAAVEAGRGFTIMGEARAAAFADRGVQLRRLAGPRRTTTLALATLTGTTNPVAERFAQHCTRAGAQGPGEPSGRPST